MRERLTEYSGYHRSAANEVCHYIGIPTIIIGAGTLLGFVPLVHVGAVSVTAAEVITAGISVFYVISARWLGVVTALILALLVALGRSLPLLVGTGLFLGGWAVQFIGHAWWEKRSPAFIRNLLHLLVGPAWLVERALDKR